MGKQSNYNEHYYDGEHLSAPILTTHSLTIGYQDTKTQQFVLHKDLDLSIFNGELVCLIGPNGAGKSTLMRTLAGLQKPLSGHSKIEGTPIKNLHPRKVAQLLSIVLTEKINIDNLSVFNVVSIGRHPHSNWLGRLSKQDNKIIMNALEMVSMQNFVNRNISQLSDGEKQRVMIAKALAQDTPLILLDEPTAHLDLPNRVEIMRLLRKLAKFTNKAVLLSTHELDLALQAADSIWLMQIEEEIKSGTPEDLVLNGSFEDTFSSDAFDFDKHTGMFKMNHQKMGEIKLEGNSIRGFWTKRALEREGYNITNNDTCEVSITVNSENWEIKTGNSLYTCNDIKELLHQLRIV